MGVTQDHSARDDPSAVLASLTKATAGQWQRVGAVLRDLERISPVSGDGRTWHEVVRARLDELGHPVSPGHLHKVRRSHAFLSEGIRHLGLAEADAARARIASVETAERLHQIDADEGWAALRDCLDPASPATQAQVRARLDAYLEAHPDRRTPKQVAWARRRSEPAAGDAAPGSTIPDGVEVQGSRSILDRLARHVAGLEAAIRARDARIATLRGQLETAKAERESARGDADLLRAELHEVRIFLKARGLDHYV